MLENYSVDIRVRGVFHSPLRFESAACLRYTKLSCISRFVDYLFVSLECVGYSDNSLCVVVKSLGFGNILGDVGGRVNLSVLSDALSRLYSYKLTENRVTGVYGVLLDVPRGLEKERYPVGKKEDVKEGKAYIFSTVDGEGRAMYEVEISHLKIEGETRNFIVRITDPRLLQKTGGIVQGMSGSPIIQDGKLVGAVTHVLVNDPTRGYGIFIENMLEAAG